MAIRSLVIAPDARLHQICAPVETVDQEVRRLIDDMFETMDRNIGAGLAAPQIGVLRRVIVMDLRDPDDPETENQGPFAMVNPDLIWRSQEVDGYAEGCLSIPEQRVYVERPKHVTVRYTDEHGKKQELEAGGYLAKCIQHEIDHLDGILSYDYLSSLKRSMVLRRLQKWQKYNASEPSSSL